MKLTLIAVGSRGDVQPILALGVGLKRQAIMCGSSLWIVLNPLCVPMDWSSGLCRAMRRNWFSI